MEDFGVFQKVPILVNTLQNAIYAQTTPLEKKITFFRFICPVARYIHGLVSESLQKLWLFFPAHQFQGAFSLSLRFPASPVFLQV